MNTPFRILIIIMCLTSCSRETKQVEGHYYPSLDRYRQVEFDLENRYASNDFHSEAFIDFFRNGRYCIYINKFEEGSYEILADSILLKPIDSEPWKLKFIKDETLGHFQFPKADNISTFRKLPNTLDKDFPFTPELNQWRIKSEGPLSNNELIEKFQNYTAFMQAYMRWAKQNEASLRFNLLSGPLQYANNGLMMRKLKKTVSWCEYFVEGDCEQLDRILRNYFDGLIIDWKYTHNRIAMLIDALDQVSKGIENHKENFRDQ